MSDNAVDKFSKILGSFGMSAGIVQLIIVLFLIGGNTTTIISAMTIGTFAMWPITYKVADRIIKKRNERAEKEWQCVETSFAMLAELNEKDKTYVQTTTNFLNKIYQKEQEENVQYSSTLCININSLIYLINANYYTEIIKYLKNIKREELIDMLLEQIFLYLGDTKAVALKKEDLHTILTNCYFLTDKLKKDIEQEFNDSAVNFSGFIDHSITNRDIDIRDKEDYIKIHQEEIPKTTNFSVENMEDYKTIVEGMISIDDYLCKFGDITAIKWNYEQLKTVICYITKVFRKELIKEIDNYTEFDLTASLAHNALAYAVLNKKETIDYNVLLNTFKDWEYLPYNIRCEIASYLIDELKISKTAYPLNIKKTSKEYKKILEFNNYKQGQ